MKYADAGVNIQKADEAMRAIKGMVKSTYTDSVMADFGNFGGLFSLGNLNMEEPILVSSIDGVGTKIRIAIKMGAFLKPGYDIVNHCVNDILVQGARPLFFMDYFATGRLDEEALTGVVKGLTNACKNNKCALLGGETAEMPGIYHGNDFDLAGSIVGVVDKKNLIDGSKIKEGDILLGLASSGLHTNGYSLVRKVLFDKANLSLNQFVEDCNAILGDLLVEPHKSYLNSILPLVEKQLISGLAHITGGGFEGNIPRILPEGLGVKINKNSWQVPPIFRLIQKIGEVDEAEMYKTFNMGVGLIAIVPSHIAGDIQKQLHELGERVFEIGAVTSHAGKVEFI